MAKPPMKPARDTASDADWQIASQREGALKMLLRSSSPARSRATGILQVKE